MRKVILGLALIGALGLSAGCQSSEPAPEAASNATDISTESIEAAPAEGAPAAPAPAEEPPAAPAPAENSPEAE